MILRPMRLPDVALPRPACAVLGGGVLGTMPINRIGACGRHRVGRRKRAYCREERGAFKGGVQTTTDRGPDKRPQGAARSVGCFCLDFSLIGQCAASARNVRAPCNILLELSFPHIAGAGHG